MTDTAEHLVRLRRLDSQTKADRVRAVIDAMADGGEPLVVAHVARKAAVSRRFIYDHPELRADIERRSAEIADRFITTVAASARVTGASLRADLENVKAQNVRLRGEIGLLAARLGESVASDVRSEMSGRGVLDAAAPNLALEEHRAEVADLHSQLTSRNDELQAARQINRELMEKLNAAPHTLSHVNRR